MTIDPHLVLYRFFDSDGQLLYIGKSISVWNRFSSHRRKSGFFPDAANVTLERGFSTEAELVKAEADAIRAEQPMYNVAHNTKSGYDRECHCEDCNWLDDFIDWGSSGEVRNNPELWEEYRAIWERAMKPLTDGLKDMTWDRNRQPFWSP